MRRPRGREPARLALPGRATLQEQQAEGRDQQPDHGRRARGGQGHEGGDADEAARDVCGVGPDRPRVGVHPSAQPLPEGDEGRAQRREQNEGDDDCEEDERRLDVLQRLRAREPDGRVLEGGQPLGHRESSRPFPNRTALRRMFRLCGP